MKKYRCYADVIADDTNLEREMSDVSDDSDDDDDSDDYDEDSNINNSEFNSYVNDQLVQKSLLTLQSNEPLGNWEKYTRGIGSKLMIQMGYVIGTGLGKQSNGRIEPIETQILPAGKSLGLFKFFFLIVHTINTINLLHFSDHCMKLREFAGNDKDLFSAERKIRKQQQKLEQQRERQYQKESQKKDSNVFNFINKTLGDKRKLRKN